MTAEFVPLYEPLLEWIYEHSGGNPLGEVDLRDFACEHDLTEDQAWGLLRYSKGKGAVDDRHSTMGRPAANLTPYGTEVMEERRRHRASPVARSRAARRGLLVWLWTQKDQGVNYPVVAKVLEAPESVFEGARLTTDDIDRAAAYLQEKGLIRGIGVDESRGPIRAEITAEGQDCVEHFDGDAGAYGRRNSGATYNTYLPNAQGVIVGEQQNFTQNNTAGVDPRAFIQLAGYVGQVSATLGLPEEERLELERVAQGLHDEATSQSPERGRLRELASQVKDKLLSAVTTMAARVGVQMAEQALGQLT